MSDNMTVCGTIFDVKRFAVHDGPGIRTTVFLKGCPLQCQWCHNPEGIEAKREVMFAGFKCINCRLCADACPVGAIGPGGGTPHRRQCRGCGSCARACPTGALRLVGQQVTVMELMNMVERDVLLYDNSGGGITFSGGEPLMQHEFLLAALKGCKQRGLATALDTSGYAPAAVFAAVSGYVDVFLFDLKLADDEQHRHYTGVSNAPCKGNLAMLAAAGRGSDVVLRLPVVPGITATAANIDGLVDFAASLKGVRRLELLPFHPVAEKYARLGREYPLADTGRPGREDVARIRSVFEKKGFVVKG